MAKLPKGVKVCIGAKVYRGEIPDNLCPKKFLEKSKVTPDGSKLKGTGGE